VSLPRISQILAWSVSLLVIGLSGTAQADPSIDAATQASAVNQEECANVHTLKQRTSAAGVQKVAEVWNEVGRVYEEEGKAPYLLFWRGVLAQCLGRNELAVLDLESFVASQKGQSMFVDLVRQSKSRLKRLGSRGKVGEGPSAAWLRKSDIVELTLSYGVATGLRGMGCTDTGGESFEEREPDTVSRVPNSTCVGGSAAQTSTGDALLLPAAGSPPPFWPVGLRFAATAFPLPPLGFGGVLQLDAVLQSEALELHAPGPVTQLFLGPLLRVKSSVSSGRRASELRIAPRFAVAWGRANPWAGHKIPSLNDILDAGSLSTRHIGVQLELSGRFEVSPRAILSISGEFVYYFDGKPDSSTALAPAKPRTVEWDLDGDLIDVEEQVEKFPELLSTSRVYAGGRVSILVPHKVHNLAVGPFFEMGFHRTHLQYPNRLSDEWDAGTAVLNRVGIDGKPSPLMVATPADPARGLFLRKVYSTRRQDLLFRVGVEIQFGLGQAAVKK
jgi:hypothetical protein